MLKQKIDIKNVKTFNMEFQYEKYFFKCYRN